VNHAAADAACFLPYGKAFQLHEQNLDNDYDNSSVIWLSFINGFGDDAVFENDTLTLIGCALNFILDALMRYLFP
jgi:hypothetical protein